MKPLYLEMEAFLAYKEKSVIDFTRLEGLFLINGQTGSGKTSIFDAISFAIYGEASGGYRKSQSLVSDYPHNNRAYVLYRFSYHDISYEITRYPRQYQASKRKVKDGSGLVLKPEEVILKYSDKVLSGNEANEKIIDVIGLKSSEFRQTILIAQGDYQNIINKDTSNRVEIFRKIFNTSGIRDSINNLKGMRDNLDLEYKSYESQIKGIYSGYKPMGKRILDSSDLLFNTLKDNIDIIENELDLVKNDIRILESKALDAKNNIDIKRDRYNKDLLNNKRIREYQENKEKLNSLVSFETLYNQNIIKCSNHINAIDTIKAFSTFNNTCEEIIKNERSLKELKDDKQKAQIEFALLSGSKDEILRLRNENKDINEKINILKNEIILHDKYVRFSNRLLSLKEESKALKDLNLNNEKIVFKYEDDYKDFNKEILDMREEKENEKYNHTVGDFNRLLLVMKSYDNTMLNLKNTLISLKDVNNKIIDARVNLINHELLILSSNLKDGESCPLCGSLNHPKLFKGNDTNELNLDDLEKKHTAILKEVTVLEETTKSYSKEREELVLGLNLDIKEFDSNQVAYIKNALKEYLDDADIRHRKYIEMINIYNARYKEYLDALESNKLHIAKLEVLTKEENELNGSIKSLDSVSNLDGNAIKADLDALNKVYLNNEMKADELSLNYEKKESIVKQISASISVLERVVDGNTKRRDMEEAILKELLVKYMFKNIEEARTYVLDDNTYLSLSKSNKEYYDSLIKHKALDDNFIKDGINLLNIVDTDSLKQTLEECEKNQESLDKSLYEMKHIYASNSDLLKRLKEMGDDIIRVEGKYNMINNLYLTSSGNLPGRKRIDFEVYYQAFFFKQILSLASLKLMEMTNNKFELRYQESDKLDGKRGLDIDVLDNYTGQLRDISSLSGGESFMASLALSLSTAETIQRLRGGISFDAMFIDEGFGSLDSEHLNGAIRILLEMCQNKTIGIISHVNDLKNVIDKQIVVSKDNDGSHIKVIF